MDDPRNTGETPLYLAAMLGNLEIMQILIDHGADVNRHSSDGSFPLYVAARQERYEAVRLLLDNKV